MLWVVGLVIVAAGVAAAFAFQTGFLGVSQLPGPMDEADSEAKARALVDEVRREKAAKDAEQADG